MLVSERPAIPDRVNRVEPTASTGLRRALPADRARTVETVVAAFAPDPAWSYLTAGEYERVAPLLAGALFDSRVDSGHVWLSGDGAAVAMWEPPRATPSADSAAIWRAFRRAAGASVAERVAIYNGSLAAAAPSEPHWYLGTLATHPERQREGLATSTLAPVLAVADADDLPCCLETSTEANRRFYAGRGFLVASDITTPGGPPVWWLTRPATRARAAPRTRCDGSGGTCRPDAP